MVFDRNDGDRTDNTEGGSCACDTFSYLVDANGDPAPMFSASTTGDPARSKFVENPANGTCEVTPAAGPIVSDRDHTGGQQVWAWPYEVPVKGKGAYAEKLPGVTSVFIEFRTDRAVAGQLNRWLLWSQGETIPIEDVVDPDDPTRVVTAENHLFDLWLAGARGNGNSPQCANVSMTFKMTFKRFEVTQVTQ